MTAKVMRFVNPAIKITGFRAEIKRLWLEQEGRDALEEWRQYGPRFIPDGYLIDEQKREVIVYEVEDTHPCPPKKLMELAYFRFFLDTYDWEFRAIVLDRYGQNPRELPLVAYYYTNLNSAETE
jgi:hypothetical protein